MKYLLLIRILLSLLLHCCHTAEDTIKQEIFAFLSVTKISEDILDFLQLLVVYEQSTGVWTINWCMANQSNR